MLEVFKFFSDNKTNGYALATFRKEWTALNDKDKEDLRNGIKSGTLDY